jgi:hypothetical protein
MALKADDSLDVVPGLLDPNHPAGEVDVLPVKGEQLIACEARQDASASE